MSYAAKSVILDIADNRGETNYLGLRSVDFWYQGSKITNLLADFTAYHTSAYSDLYGSEDAFDTSVSKIGDSWDGDVTWMSGNVVTNQRLICVLNSSITFDEIRINNYHDSGSQTIRGAQNVVINISTDAITDTTYNAAIANSTKIFDGVFDEHVASDVEDEQTLTLIQPPITVGHFTTTNTLTGSVEFNQITAGHFQTTNTLIGSAIAGAWISVGHFTTTNILTGSAISGLLLPVGHFTTTNILTGSVEFNQIAAGHFQTTNALAFSSYILSVMANHLQTDNAISGSYELIKYENYISLFRFILTGDADGVADAEIPITSFQIRMYADKNSYLVVNIPSVGYADQITARPNGTLKLMIVYSKIHTLTEIRSETLLETRFDTIRTHDGSKKQSITLEGHETGAQATARQVNPKTITLNEGWVNYRRTGTAGWTSRLARPHLDLRAGDTVIDAGITYTVDRITWMKSESVHHMEITGGTI